MSSEQVYKDTVATDPGFIFLLMVGLYFTVALMFFVLLVLLLRYHHRHCHVTIFRSGGIPAMPPLKCVYARHEARHGELGQKALKENMEGGPRVS